MSKVSKKPFIKPKNITEKISDKKLLELSNVRILQRNLVYVIGLSSEIAKLEVKSFS